MCDTYDATCEEPGCDKTLPYHLPDFSVPRSAVHVRCRKHMPPRQQGWTRVVMWGREGKRGLKRVPRDLWFFEPYYLLVDGVSDPLGAGHGVNECLDEEGELW